MIEILPSVIPQSYEDLKERVASVSYFTSIIHVDVCDGIFVPRKSWPYVGEREEFDRIVRQEQGLPQWETVDYEVHLMVANPQKDVEDWIQAGAKRIIVHIETLEDPKKLIDELKEKYKYTTDGEYAPFELGFALKLETPVSEIEPYINDITFVQCMGIKRVGFSGELIDFLVFEKITSLREKHAQLPISEDGGLTLENAKDIIRAGATRLVSGSAIYESDNIPETIEELRIVDEKIKQGLL